MPHTNPTSTAPGDPVRTLQENSSMEKITNGMENVNLERQSSLDWLCDDKEGLGQISIELAKGVVAGGETVRGEAVVTLEQGADARVVVDCEGYERTAMEEPFKAKGDGSVTAIRPLKDHHRIYFKEAATAQTYTQGQHRIPFTFPLPEAAPGSFHTSLNGEKSHACVEYRVRAKLTVGRECLKTHQKVVVREHPVVHSPKLGLEDTTSVSDGSEGLTLALGDTQNTTRWHHPGDTILFRVQANNTTVGPTTPLTVTVYRRLSVVTCGREQVTETKIHTDTVDPLPPLFWGELCLPYTIPIEAQPTSVRGKLCCHSYRAVVEGGTPSSHTPKHLTVPFTIAAPKYLYGGEVPPPPAPAGVPSPVLFRPQWQDDRTCEACNRCQKLFTLLRRRHHCRQCLLVYCGECSGRIRELPQLGYGPEPQRVCDTCFHARPNGHGHRGSLSRDHSKGSLVH